MGVALAKFRDALNTGSDGRAFITAFSQNLVVENSTSGGGAAIGSWRITLLQAPPGSARERRPFIDPLSSFVLAENASSDTPQAVITNLETGFYGCYRVMIEVWSGSNYAGAKDTDIRNAAIPTPNRLLIIPPYQRDPDPLPLTGPGSKPDELNFPNVGDTEDQRWGWAGPRYNGSQYAYRMMNEALLALDSVVGATDQYVAASATDTTPGTLEDKFSVGAGFELVDVNPGGDESKVLGFAGYDAALPTDLISIQLALPAIPRYVTTDGEVLWTGINSNGGFSGTGGYLKWSPSGTVFDDQRNIFGDSRDTYAMFFDAVNDQMVALRYENNVSSGLQTVSRDAIPVVGTYTSVGAEGYVNGTVGDGYAWLLFFGGSSLVKVLLSNLATQVEVSTAVGQYVEPVFDPGPVNRYGDGEGRVYVGAVSTGQLDRYTSVTDAADGSFLPGGSTFQTIRALAVDVVGGRLWSVRDFTIVDTFDCEPFGANPRSVDISTHIPAVYQTHSVFYSNGYLYVLGYGGGGVPKIVKLEDTGSVVNIVDVATFNTGGGAPSNYQFAWSQPNVSHLCELGGRLYFGARESAGTFEDHILSVAVNDFTDISIADPKTAGWVEYPGLVRVSDTDTVPKTLSSKFSYGFGQAGWEKLPDTGSGESLRYHGVGDVLLARNWQYSPTTTMADPGALTFRMNNADPSLVTALAFNVNVLVDGSVSAYEQLKQVSIGTTLFLRQTGALSGSNAPCAVFRVNAIPTDNTTWFQFSVQFLRVGATAWPANGFFAVDFVGGVNPVTSPLELHRWRFENITTMAAPTNFGEFRLNGAWNASTQLALSSYMPTGPFVGVFAGYYLNALKLGDYLVLRKIQGGGEAIAILLVNGTPVDNTSWWQVPISFQWWSTAPNLPADEDYFHIEIISGIGSSTDANAIHDNVAGEIAAVTEKTYPVSADLVLVEDSAAANAKARVQAGNLPALYSSTTISRTGTTNDWNSLVVMYATTVELTTSAGNATITGISASAILRNAYRKALVNTGPDIIILAHQNAGSLAANRFTSPTNADYYLLPGESCIIEYHGSTLGWLIIGRGWTLSEYSDSGSLGAYAVNYGSAGGIAEAWRRAEFWILNQAAVSSIGSFEAFGGDIVRRKKLHFTSSNSNNTLSLIHNDVTYSTTPANRLSIPGNNNLLIHAGDIVDLTWSELLQLWVVG